LLFYGNFHIVVQDYNLFILKSLGENTIASEKSLETYLKEINKISLLTKEEEKALAIRVAKGDLEAREQMIQANLRLVVSIAKNYINRGLSLEDLIEEGNVGLLKGVEKFDVGEECRFSTYATWWIKQSIRRALTNTVKTVRIPSYMVELISKWNNAMEKLTLKLDRKPSMREISDELGLSPDNVMAIKHAIRTASLTANPYSLEVSTTLSDAIKDEKSKRPDDEVLTDHEIIQIKDLLNHINEREANILKMRFGIGYESSMTLKEIGETLNLTRERVRQIQNEALKKLFHIMNRESISPK
jgi:RNA polymerase primary sigma factor